MEIFVQKRLCGMLADARCHPPRVRQHLSGAAKRKQKKVQVANEAKRRQTCEVLGWGVKGHLLRMTELTPLKDI